jgi:hypothetical protein
MTTASNHQVHVYSDAREAVLQLRRNIATTDDLTATSFKVGVVLNADEVLELAGELMTVASVMVRAARKPNQPGPKKTPAENAGVNAKPK